MNLARPALVALLVCAACSAPSSAPYPESSTRSDVIDAREIEPFLAARAALERGDARAAAEGFARLLADDPSNVPVGMWLQDAQIALAEGDEARRALVERTELAAERAPSLASCVLAARLCADRTRALAWLDRAEALDPDSPWVAYGRAYLSAAAAEWGETRRWLSRALELDPGHPWARWLEAWLLARDGELAEASAVLDRWIATVRDDPRIDARRLAEARLDRAILDAQAGDADSARERLEALRGAPASAGRVAAVAAAIAGALGEWETALARARDAHDAEPNAVLPLLQEALLLDIARGDPKLAEAAWGRVIAATETRGDLVSLLERTRARARLERLRADRAATEPPQ